MSDKNTLKPLAIALGAVLATGLSVSNAAENPFGMKSLSSGYMVAEKAAEGKCGEGKCGEKKCTEAKCGEAKAACEKKAKEGKCGEGKCGEKK